MKCKKGMASIWIIALVLIGGFFLLGGMSGIGDFFSVAPSVEESQVTQKELSSCDGVASVNVLFDDKNTYKIGTDPATNMTIFEKDGAQFSKTVVDDSTSTTVDVLSSYKALAGNYLGTPSTSYFGKVVNFDSVCSDVDQQTKLIQAGAPTITLVGDDGVTKNADATHDTNDADSSYSPTMTVKAPADKCSSEYGAFVVFESDATYIQTVDSSDLVDEDTGIYIAHTTNHSATGLDMDQYKVMKYEGKLCDGDKADITFSLETTSSTPGEDQANIKIHWLPINYDLNADNLELINGIYDEDNNAIFLGNTTATYYTS